MQDLIIDLTIFQVIDWINTNRIKETYNQYQSKRSQKQEAKHDHEMHLKVIFQVDYQDHDLLKKDVVNNYYMKI